MVPKLSVVVPTHGRPQDIAALLKSLRGQNLAADQVEILIVSNFPDRALEAVIAEWRPQTPYALELLVTGQLGVNCARNRGLQAARGEIVLLLDDDCYAPDEEFLERLLKTHAEFPEALAVGGAYLSPPQHGRVGVQYNWICNDWLNAQFVSPTPTSRLLGGCVSYKVAILRAGGLQFNETIRYGGSETEFHLRLVALGHTMIYHPQHTVVHDCKINGRDLSRKAYQQGMAKWGRMKRGELEKAPPPMLGDPLLWKNKLKDSFYGQLHRHFFARGYERARLAKPPTGKLFFFISVLLSYLELFAMGFGFGYPLYKILTGDQVDTVRIYHFFRQAFLTCRMVVRIWLIRTRFAILHFINKIAVHVYWRVRRVFSGIRILGIKIRWLIQGWVNAVVVQLIRAKFAIYRYLDGWVVRVIRTYWWYRRRRVRAYTYFIYIYWCLRPLPARLRTSVHVHVYWFLRRRISGIRLAGIAAYWALYTWRSRVRVNLIRGYWRFYPLFCHIKGYWRSPRHLIWRGLKLKMPLNYPTLMTEGPPLWAAPLRADHMHQSPQQLAAQWRSLGLHAVEVEASELVERAVFVNAVGLPCHVMHSALSEVQPATSLRRNFIVLSLSEIAAQSAEILQWLRSVPGDFSLLLTVDGDVADESVRGFLREVRNLASLTGLSLQFDARTNIEFGEGMRFFRWLYQLSLHAEGLQIKWQRYYRYLTEREALSEKLVPLQLSSATAPEVSVLIPHHCDFCHLQTTLQFLSRQTLALEKFEVIVIDNGIEGQLLAADQRQALQAFGLNLTVLTMQSPDAELFLSGQARNRGLQAARGRIVQFLDSDILLPPNYLTHLVAEMQNADVVMAKRSMLKEGVSGIDTAATYLEDEYWENFKRAKTWTDLREFWKYSCTYCFAVKRTWLEQAGPFDPKFTMYGFEDVDLGFRLAKLQARFAFASERVFHLFPSRDQHNYHLDMQRRAQALSRSALTLFMSRPETDTFGLCQGYFAPTLIQWVWQGIKGAGVRSVGVLTPRWIRVTSAR